MIAENATKAIEQAVCYELQNAVKNFGATYHSEHEAYAVLLEEIEEAEEDVTLLKKALENIWIAIRNNKPITDYDLHIIKEMSLALAEEAVQCAAVSDKFVETVRK